MSFIAIPAIAVTDTILTSVVPETDHAIYNPATTYALADRCISATTHRIYESGQAGNIGHAPTDAINLAGTPPWWIDRGPTNKYAMFDGEVSTPTVHASPLTVVLTPGNIDALYLFGMDADTLDVSIKDAPDGTIIYTAAIGLEKSKPDNLYDWIFLGFQPQRDVVLRNIPPYYGMEVTVTLTRTGGTVQCGMMGLGLERVLGDTLRGSSVKPKTFSYIDINEFGDNVIVRRKSARDLAITARLPLSEATQIKEAIEELLDIPCAWIGSELSEYAGLMAYGLGSADIRFDQPDTCLLTADIKGLI